MIVKTRTLWGFIDFIFFAFDNLSYSTDKKYNQEIHQVVFSKIVLHMVDRYDFKTTL